MGVPRRRRRALPRRPRRPHFRPRGTALASDLAALPEPSMTASHAASIRADEPGLSRYDRMQRLFHWGMAAIILAAVALGLYCSFQVPGTQPRKFLLEIHKSLGTTAFALVLLRIAYRLAVGAPGYRRPLG